MDIAYLVESYGGDAAWSEFALAWGARSDSIESVLDAVVHDGAAWLESPVPALGGVTPMAVLDNAPDGIKAIRELIMRMP